MIDTNKPITKISYNGNLMYLYEGAVERPKDLFNQFMSKTLIQLTEEDLEGTTSLGSSFFANQSYLQKIEIPDTVTSMGQELFSGCTSLNSIKLSKNCQALSAYFLRNCRNVTELDIPEGVITIGSSCFEFSGITKFYVPTTAQTTGDNTFRSTSSPRDVYIKDLDKFANMNVKGNIYGNSWWGTGNGFHLYLNNELITILNLDRTIVNNSSFRKLLDLTRVVLSSNIELIEANAFAECSNLKEFIINKPCTTADEVPVLTNTNAVPTSCPIYVPDELTKSLYQQATNWSVYTIKLTSELTA